MRYMLLLYANEAAGQSLAPDEMAAWMEKMSAYGAALKKAGALVSTGGLGLSASALTLHTEKDKLQVHAGPYAETQEQLGGYFLIDADSMDAARAWAARCPAVLWGHIEIRQVAY
ncbi:MAG: YciI family protein [Devosia sp.]